jgi:hypothetical protein
MMKSALLGALALALARLPAAAEEAARCIDVSVPKGATAAADGKWIELTSEQWQFLRGVYVLDPDTPAGLPYGDRAALAKVPGRSGGLVFFLDGDKACTPMAAPAALLDLLGEVAAGATPHEGVEN